MAILDFIQGAKGSVAGLMPTLYMIGYYVGVMAIFLVMGFFALRYILQMSKYKYEVTIFTRRGEDDFIITRDKAGYIKKDGRTVFRLLKGKTNIEPPNYDNVVLTNRGRSNIYYLKIGEQEYYPLKIRGQFEDFKFEPIDMDVLNWLVSEKKAIVERYKKQTFLEQYLPIFSVVGVMMFAGIVMWMVLGKAELISAGLSKASSVCTQAIQNVPPAIFVPFLHKKARVFGANRGKKH